VFYKHLEAKNGGCSKHSIDFKPVTAFGQMTSRGQALQRDTKLRGVASEHCAIGEWIASCLAGEAKNAFDKSGDRAGDSRRGIVSDKSVHTDGFQY
jgi:hypothetical protein